MRIADERLEVGDVAVAVRDTALAHDSTGPGDPISGKGTCSFDIAGGRMRAIDIVRNPDKLRGFLEHTQARRLTIPARLHTLTVCTAASPFCSD